MTDPLSPEEIEELRRWTTSPLVEAETWQQLLDIAEDHARLHAENAKLRERGDKFRDLEAQAAEHVEVQLLNRTDFDPDGEIVGWPGLGLALNRTLDERDKLRERVGKLERYQLYFALTLPVRKPDESWWHCLIGPAHPDDLPPGSDAPMRDAVSGAFHRIAGTEHVALFSGWGASPTESQRAVIVEEVPNYERALAALAALDEEPAP